MRQRRSDGYHELETIFAFCDFGDAVTGAPARQLALTIGGPFAHGLSPTDNLVIAAAQTMGKAALLHLEKRLPVASGIGGGSADAGATLRLLARMHDAPLPSLAMQRALGADVPACVVSQTVRGDGVGDVLTPVESVGGTPVLLVNPGIALATGAVFAGWDGIDRGPLGRWQEGRNDLQMAACSIVPEIGTLIEWLARRRDVTFARMSGSGATCFALFASAPARARAARETRAAFPDYWALESTLR